MTIERKTDPSRDAATSNWMPKARRHGEHADWTQGQQFEKAPGDEIVIAPVSSPPSWPRVFPGI